MKIRNLLILGLVLLGFTYCSSDEVLDGPTTETVDGVKMQLTIQMPTSATTRSSTNDTGGTGIADQAGTTNEQTVNEVLVALYKKVGAEGEGTFMKTHLSTTLNKAGALVTTEEFALNKTDQAVTAAVGDKYYVLVFVNPYPGLQAKLDATPKFSDAKNLDFTTSITAAPSSYATDIAAVTKLGGATTGDQTNFFMSNAGEMSEATTIAVDNSHIQGSPLKAAVSVQRAVARFDYTAGSVTDYPIQDKSNNAVVGLEDLTVTFTHYKPMNASKNFFNLKRVGAPADTDGVIGAKESASNFVIDTDWGVKVSPEATPAWKSSFHSYMGSETAPTAFVPLGSDPAINSFYALENTLPSGLNVKGVATAIVFKGKLNFPANEKYGTSTEGTETVYVYNGKFVGVFSKLPAAIQLLTPTDISALANAGVTGYSYVEDAFGAGSHGYPIYYVYYNAHNQNATIKGEPTVQPMEFGVVRNNIYQLSITKLSKLGHPNDPELETPLNPDPNPEDPTHPIKSKDLYMQVTATVLDWTVRTNEIEF